MAKNYKTRTDTDGKVWELHPTEAKVKGEMVPVEDAEVLDMKTLEDMADAVEAGIYTEERLVKSAKAYIAIENQREIRSRHEDKKFTKAQADKYYNLIPLEQIQECHQSGNPAACILKLERALWEKDHSTV